MVSAASANCFRPSLDHDSDCDVSCNGSWSHIIGNMIFLWAFAPEIEDAMGRGRYLVFYLVGGLVAMLAQVLADPHSTVPNLGASGAIAAVMGGAFLVTYPRDQIRTLLLIFVFGSSPDKSHLEIEYGGRLKEISEFGTFPDQKQALDD